MGVIANSGQSFMGVLRSGEARRVAAGGLVGRFREAGTGLALILAVRHVHASFAAAGAASAAYLLAAAIARPAHGRWVDRAGSRVPLLVASGANTIMLVAVAFAAWQMADASVLIVLSGLVGVTLPALSATLRALWPRLAPGAGDRAYALDTLSYELSLIASPALVGVVAVAGSPSLALLVIAVLGLTGTAVVASAPAARARAHTSGSVDRIGRGVTHAVLLLIAVSLFVGAAEGAMTVLAPAVASAHRDHAAGGLLLSCLAGGSLIGALAYGAFGDRGTLARRLVAATAGLTLAFLLLALFGSTLVGFAVCAALVGLVLSPTLTIGFVAIRHAAPFGSLTETFTWASFAATAGAAASQALAGLTVAGPGADAALWIPMAFAAGALAAATVRRQAHRHREVHPSPPPAERSASDCPVRPEAVTQRS